MENQERYDLFCTMIDTLDIGVKSITEYDQLLHDYNGVILYQAESQIIKAVGNQPGITASELSKIFDKTSSACSQLVRKLKRKGWLHQRRNVENNREYNLFLTEDGQLIYKNHHEFEENCYLRSFAMLNEVSEDDMRAYVRVQACLNAAFQMDVEESREISSMRQLSPEEPLPKP